MEKLQIIHGEPTSEAIKSRMWEKSLKSYDTDGFCAKTA
jgi:hypothetical protein